MNEKIEITKPVLKILKKKLALSDVVDVITETLDDCGYFLSELQNAKKGEPGYEFKRVNIEQFGYEWTIVNDFLSYMLTNLETKVKFGKSSRDFHKFFVMLCNQVIWDVKERKK
jgi:hypothetical protein